MKKIRYWVIITFVFLIAIYKTEGQNYIEFESKGNYINGVKNGKWIDINKNGVIYKEYYYENGIPVGTWKKFRPDGQIRYESIIANNKITVFKMYRPNLSSVEIICDSGFSEKQFTKLIDFEEYFYKDQLFKLGLKNNGMQLAPGFRDEWIDNLKTTLYSLKINLNVKINFADGPIETEMIFDVNKAFLQIDYTYDKHGMIKRKDYKELGKIIKSLYYKNGVLVKEEKK